jgi:hypothetical protein
MQCYDDLVAEVLARVQEIMPWDMAGRGQRTPKAS